jgi:hypothetical protein
VKALTFWHHSNTLERCRVIFIAWAKCFQYLCSSAGRLVYLNFPKRLKKSQKQKESNKRMSSTAAVDGSPTNITVNAVVLSLIGVYYLISATMFWVRRNQEPIRARKPKLVLFSLTSYFIYGIMKCLVHAFKNPLLKCAMTVIVEKLLEVTAYSLVLLRIGLLYLDFVVANKSEKFVFNTRATAVSIHSADIPLYLRIRKFMKTRVRRLLVLGGIVIFLLGAVMAVYGWKLFPLINADYLDPACIDSQEYIRAVEIPTELIINGFIGIAAFRLWKVQEHFGIFKEVITVVACLLFKDIFLLADVQGTIEPMLAQAAGVQYYQLLEIMVPVIGMTIISLNYQSYLVDQWNNVLKEAVPGAQYEDHDPQELAEFLEILNTQRGYFAFSNFAMLDLASERLLFWRDIENFRKKDVSAREIYDTYLSADAPLHVKLSSDVFAKISEFFERIEDRHLNRTSSIRGSISVRLLDSKDPEQGHKVVSITNVFDEAQNEIFLNLFQTSYGRFKMTDEYKRIKEKFEVSGSKGTADKVTQILEQKKQKKLMKKRSGMFKSFQEAAETSKTLLEREAEMYSSKQKLLDPVDENSKHSLDQSRTSKGSTMDSNAPSRKATQTSKNE